MAISRGEAWMSPKTEVREIEQKETWINPKIEIKEVKNKGKGMFATELIKVGETVLVWGGVWGEDYTNEQGANQAKAKGKLVIQWDDDLYSVEDKGEELGYFLNHSCDPNVWMKDAFTLIAKRDIQAGEEVVADYVFWEADPNYMSEWQCQCGSPMCRERVTGNDWKLLELQEKYKGHFSPLINKRIEKSNMYSKNNQVVSFDFHDTILVLNVGGELKNIKLFRAILYFLSNFKLFIFIYTAFCKRNELIIELMRKLKADGNRVIILTSTYKKSAKIIHYFLRKNNVVNYDEIIFRQNFWQKEGDYKIEEIIKNNISLHYDDNQEACSEINAQGRACLAVVPWYNK